MSTHAQRYEILAALFSNEPAQEQAAALYLLAANEELCSYAAQFISPETGLDYEVVGNHRTIQGPVENALAWAALNLYTHDRYPGPSPYDLSQLLAPVPELCNTAILIARGDYRVQVQDLNGEKEFLIFPSSWEQEQPDEGMDR